MQSPTVDGTKRSGGPDNPSLTDNWDDAEGYYRFEKSNTCLNINIRTLFCNNHIVSIAEYVLAKLWILAMSFMVTLGKVYSATLLEHETLPEAA